MSYQENCMDCELRAQLSAAQSQLAWQDISSAPKDGTEHLRGLFVHNKSTGKTVFEQHLGWITDDGSFGDENSPEFGWEAEDYTHWMPKPLPPAPSEPADK